MRGISDPRGAVVFPVTLAFGMVVGCTTNVSGDGGGGDGGQGGGTSNGPTTTGSDMSSAAESSAESSGSGTTTGGCSEVVPSGPTECPEVWTDEVNDMLPCAAPAGTTCAYPVPGSGWQACTCGCFTEWQWACYGEFGGPNCPAEQPAQGASCASMLGSTCPYFPSTHCTCKAEEGTWSCSESGPNEPAWPCFDAAPPSTQPSGIDPATPLGGLSTADATSWCTWYMNAYPPGGQLPPDYPAEDGKAWGGATMGCHEQTGCVQHLKVEHCVANLALGGCTATLGQLEDCVRTILNQCELVGHGCGPFHACSGCEATIVQIVSSGVDSGCAVPVE